MCGCGDRAWLWLQIQAQGFAGAGQGLAVLCLVGPSLAPFHGLSRLFAASCASSNFSFLSPQGLGLASQGSSAPFWSGTNVAARPGGAGPAPFHSLQPGGGGVDTLGLGSSITPAPLVHSQPPSPALLRPTGAQNPPLQSSLLAALPSSITAIVTCPVVLGVWVQLESCTGFQLQNKGTWGGDGALVAFMR